MTPDELKQKNQVDLVDLLLEIAFKLESTRSVTPMDEKLAFISSMTMVAYFIGPHVSSSFMRLLTSDEMKDALGYPLADQAVLDAAVTNLILNAGGVTDTLIDNMKNLCSNLPEIISSAKAHKGEGPAVPKSASAVIDRKDLYKAQTANAYDLCVNLNLIADPDVANCVHYGQPNVSQICVGNTDASVRVFETAMRFINAKNLEEAGFREGIQVMKGFPQAWESFNALPLTYLIRLHPTLMTKKVEKGKPFFTDFPKPTFPGFDQTCEFLASLSANLYMDGFCQGLAFNSPSASVSIISIMAGYILNQLPTLETRILSIPKGEMKTMIPLFGVSNILASAHAANPEAFPLDQPVTMVNAAVSKVATQSNFARKVAASKPWLTNSDDKYCFSCGVPLTIHDPVPKASDGKPDHTKCPANAFLKHYAIIDYKAGQLPLCVKKVGQ